MFVCSNSKDESVGTAVQWLELGLWFVVGKLIVLFIGLLFTIVLFIVILFVVLFIGLLFIVVLFTVVFLFCYVLLWCLLVCCLLCCVHCIVYCCVVHRSIFKTSLFALVGLTWLNLSLIEKL